jgi:hypothetical protein
MAQKMGEIVTYKNVSYKGVYSQIKLDNGERILISISQKGLQIYKLGFGGLFPTGTVWETLDLDQMIVLFGDFSLSENLHSENLLLDAVIKKLIGCGSIDEVKTVLTSPADSDSELSDTL